MHVRGSSAEARGSFGRKEKKTVGNHGARKVAEAPRKFCAEATSRDMLISFISIGQDFIFLKSFSHSDSDFAFVAMDSSEGTVDRSQFTKKFSQGSSSFRHY